MPARRRPRKRAPRGSLLPDHLSCPFKNSVWNCQTNLFCGLQVDNKLKLRCLLHRQISRFGTLQNLIYIVRGTAEEIFVAPPVGHETPVVDKLLRKVNSRQPMLPSQLDDPLSFCEKGASSNRHNRVDLLLLCGFKGAL